MCVDPLTATTIAATGVKALGTILGAQAEVQTDRYNANAALAAGYANENIARHDASLKMANQLAALSARGAAVDSGSPLALQAESARNAELNDLQIRTNAKNKAAGYNYQASVTQDLLPVSIAGDLLGSASKMQSLGKLGGSSPQGLV